MRLLLLTFLCLSLAGVFGKTSMQAVQQIMSYQEQHYDVIQQYAGFLHRFYDSKGKVKVQDTPGGTPTAGPCDPLFQSLGQQFQSNPACSTLFASFGANPFSNSTTDPTSVTRFLDSICQNPCYPALIAGIKAITTCMNANANGGADSFFNATIFDQVFGLFCMKNPANGKYCLTIMTDPALVNLTAGGRPDNQSACFVFAQFGCCINPVFNFVGAIASMQARQLLQTACGFGVPPDCPRPGQSVVLAKATWTIKGLAFAYFQANQATVSNALRKDIAGAVGCDPGFISFTNFRQGSVIADFNIQGANDAQTTSFATALATASAATTTSFPNVAAAVGTAGLDSGSTSLGIDPTKSSSSVTTFTAPGSGTNVQPMFALVAALLAFTLFARQ